MFSLTFLFLLVCKTLASTGWSLSDGWDFWALEWWELIKCIYCSWQYMPYVVILGQQKIQLSSSWCWAPCWAPWDCIASGHVCVFVCLWTSVARLAFFTQNEIWHKHGKNLQPALIPARHVPTFWHTSFASHPDVRGTPLVSLAFSDASTSLLVRKGLSPVRHRRRLVKIEHKTYLVRISKLLVMLGFKCDVTLRSKPRPPPLLGGTLEWAGTLKPCVSNPNTKRSTFCFWRCCRGQRQNIDFWGAGN